MRRLLALTGPERPQLLAGVLSALVVALALALIPRLVVQPLFAGALSSTAPQGLSSLLLVAGGLVAAAALAQFVQDAVFGAAAARLGARLRSQVFAAWLRARPTGVLADGGGARTARLALDIRELELFLAHDVAASINQALTVAVAGVLLVGMSARLTLGLLLAVLPAAALLALITRRVEAAFRGQQEAAGAASGAMSEGLSRVETVKAFGMQAALLGRFAEPNEQQRAASARRSLLAAAQQPLAMVAMGVAVLALLALAGGELRAGTLDAAGLTTYLAQLGIAAAPLQMLARNVGRWGAMREPARSVEAALDSPPEIDLGTRTARASLGALEMRDVAVSYPDEPGRALDGASLMVLPGETVAVVGRSGAGKTTLTRLLLRLVEPEGGTVLLDGTPVKDFTLAVARASVALVPQQPSLFRGTVLENLRLARPDLDEARAESALLAAGLYDELAPLGGLGRWLGDGGEGLSGGQAQRLAIARALVTDAPILLLDEPTSALDAISEAAIRRTVASLRGSRTVVVIAHRLSLAEAVDRVIVLEGGRVVEEGAPGTLAAGNGPFARLLEAARA